MEDPSLKSSRHARRNDPMRRAEARVFDELRRQPPCPASSTTNGSGTTARLNWTSPVWLSGVGRFGLEVKGGRVLLAEGQMVPG